MSSSRPVGQRRWWTRPGFLAAAGLLVLILAIAATVAITDRPPAPTAQPSASTSVPPTVAPTSGSASPVPSATSPAPSPRGDEASVCGLSDVRMSGTVQSTPQTSWDLIGTMAAPTSEAHGPGKVEPNGYRYCFDRTPEGALFAAGNFLGLGTKRELALELLKRGTAKGKGRDAALRAAREDTSDSGDTSAVRTQIAGFKVLAYNGQEATIDVALKTSNGTFAAWAYELRWEDGDWRLVLTDTGDLPNPVVQIPNVDDYIPWGTA